MAIQKRWINWAVSIVGAILLVFSLGQLITAFYMNVTSIVNPADKLAISGALLVSLGVLLFPTAWISFCASISRHRGVYIALMVMVCLSILDAIGMLVYQVYRFHVMGSYKDTEQGVAIAMTVMQSLLILVLFFSLAFSAAGLCYQSQRSYEHKQKSFGYPTMNQTMAPPMYSREYGGYAMSLPRASGYDYPQADNRMYYSKGRY